LIGLKKSLNKIICGPLLIEHLFQLETPRGIFSRRAWCEVSMLATRFRCNCTGTLQR
jgi:hypothetical protein